MKGAGQRGIVLVAVLLMVALMSVMVVAATSLTRAGIADQRLEQRLVATHFALRSGLEGAKAVIVSTPPDQRVFFDGSPLMLELGGGLVAEVTIRDAAGLADLNRSELPLVEAVLASALGPREAQALSARIAEWRKQAAEEAKPSDGAGQPPPQPAPAANKDEQKPPAPVVFQAEEQLLAMTENDGADMLEGHVTVFNPKGLVNPLAAPDDVLLAIPGATPRDLAAIDAARKIRAWKTDQGLQQILERQKSFLAVEEPTVFMIGIRLVEGDTVITGSKAAAVVMAVDDGPLPFRTLSVSGL